MNAEYSHIALLLDSSGSMDRCREAVVSGYNHFLREQQAGPGRAALTLALFNDHLLATVKNKPLADTPELTRAEYIPVGGTALLDALGGTVQGLGYLLGVTAEAARPGRVIVAVLTDGLENTSRRYSLERVNALVRHQREKYGWHFLFLGANQDAEATAAGLGIPAHDSTSFNHDNQGVTAAFTALSRGVLSRRDPAIALKKRPTLKSLLALEDARPRELINAG